MRREISTYLIMTALFIAASVLSAGCGSSKVKTDPNIVDDTGNGKTDGMGDQRVPEDGDDPDYGTEDNRGEDGVPGEVFDPCEEYPRQVGCQCQGNADCETGYCVEGPFGFVCTKECLEDCPEGWMCKGLTGFGSDVVFLCVPDAKKLCYPCQADTQCGGGRCVLIDGSSFCTYLCDADDPCPASFNCEKVDKDGTTFAACIPKSKSCECTPPNAGEARPCTKSNDWGTCKGFEICDPDVGFVNCDAPEASEEICDGKDNDCDGSFDEDLPEFEECENSVEGLGSCKGKAFCLGPDGWVCTASQPEEEICDFKDNDCDGEIDEDFKVDGKYGSQNHCGTCNQDCTGSIPNATAVCDQTFDPPLCAVSECYPNYYKLNPFQCLPEGETLCKPCLSDIGCQGGVCAPVGNGTFCLPSCLDKECPEFFECTQIPGIDGQWCKPMSQTCDCSKANEGATRPCSKTNPTGTCFGFETCDPAVGWVGCTAGDATPEICDGLDNDCNGVPDDNLPQGQPCSNDVPGIGSCLGILLCMGPQGFVCNAPTPEVESCDYQDNNCDGQVDEDFIVDGKYGTLHHCGGCNKDCEGALPNATAYCDASSSSPACKVESCKEGFYKLNDFQCIDPPNVQCKVCKQQKDCYFAACVPLDTGLFCLDPCKEGLCPEGFKCTNMGNYGDICVPDSGSCDCNEASSGAKRSCAVTNDLGTCFGFETCIPETGWSQCDAVPASPEKCDGLDNDCNGFIDESLPQAEPCEVTNQWGTCPGQAACLGNAGWVCQAKEPAQESCDYVDNDCDGQTDEDFKTNGKYVSNDHCGTCNNACLKAIPNATGKCDATYLIPKCVVDKCSPGYFQISPFECIVPPDTTCQPCQVDADCVGGSCVIIDGQSRCAIPCVSNDECIGETSCKAYPNKGNLCQPLSGSCECNSFTDGSKRSCSKSNEIGTCYGYQTCNKTSGWGGCDALVPTFEVCNGFDDDCNGLIDDALEPFVPCSESNQFGSCAGQAVCIGLGGWQCQAQVPAAEKCDYVDNDCDGQVDEDFKNQEGKYSMFTQCGSCTISCEAGFPNATAKCDTTKETPQCVVASCNEGYFKLNEFQCIPDTANLCEACATDDNCVLEGAKCVQLSDGKFCTKACVDQTDCPSGYSCVPYQAGKQCIPLTNSCTCSGDNPDLSRACSITWPLNPIPGEPSVTCYGTQYCKPQGWSECVLSAEACDGQDNNCDGVVDEGFLVNGKYQSTENCGQCGNNCTFLVYPNAKGVCDVAKPVPDCMMQCLNGYFDVNKNPADGCECKFLSNNDLPDGTDQNCDGVDGEINNAIFVAKNGADVNAGTINSPMLTIQKAIDKAVIAGKRDVYVATGVYGESVKLVAGIQVWGGYSSDFRTRNIVLYETVIMGKKFTTQLPGSVNALSITGPQLSTTLDGFTVFGASNNSVSGSSYAVYVKDSTNALRVTNNRIVAGNGGNGSQGVSGSDGIDGVSGSPGINASNHTSWTCTANTMLRAGGGGGSRTCGSANVSGGKGGDSYCPNNSVPPHANEAGAAGSGPGGGGGGFAGWDSYFQSGVCSTCYVNSSQPSDGGPGAAGTSGTNGAKGAGCTQPQGQVVNGFWQPAAAGTGVDGGPGGGGGGSGAGRSAAQSSSTCGGIHVGGTGGGGGSGACQGTGGSGGSGAGGAFGIFLYYSAPPASVPTILSNLLEGGNGGAGGSGGPGGTGGVGGPGGKGGAQGTGGAWCAGGAGMGATGGHGGHGGGGGGGCGGVSYCIFASGQGGANLSSYKAPGNTFFTGVAGPGGSGGPSIGNTGDIGQTGVAGETNF